MSKFAYLRLFCFLFLLTLWGCSEDPPVIQEDDGYFEAKIEEIVDPDYCFRLKVPGEEWELLSDQQIAEMAPSSIAGALIFTKAVVASVEVLPLDNKDLSEFMKITQNVFIENGGTKGFPYDLDFRGIPAIQYTSRIPINGVEYEVVNLVFIHQSFGYHLKCRGRKGTNVESHAREFWDAFSITEGTVRSRQEVENIDDFIGLGRRILEGRFESASIGMAYNSNEDWSVVHNLELNNSYPDAEFGVKNTKDEVTITVLSDVIEGRDLKVYERNVLAQVDKGDEDSDAKLLGRYRIRVGEHPVEFNLFQTKQALVRFVLEGVLYLAERAYRFSIEGKKGEPEEFLNSVAIGLSHMEFLSPEQRDQLQEIMTGQVDPENDVGHDWSLRRGLYRDFAYGFTWEKPAGFWRVEPSQVQEINANSVSPRLRIREAGLGISVKLTTTRNSGFTLEELHSQFPPRFNEPPDTYRMQLDGGPALVSQGYIGCELYGCEHRFVSTIRNSNVYVIEVSGSKESMLRHSDRVDDAVNAFKFPGRSLVPFEWDGNTFINYKFGYAVDLPHNNFSLIDKFKGRPVEKMDLMEFHAFGKAFSIITQSVLKPGQDSKFMVAKLSRALAEKNKGKKTESKVTFLGQEWLKIKVESKTVPAIYFASSRDNTIFLFKFQRTRGKPEDLVEELLPGFRFMD